MRLVLASASPRRRELLAAAGFSFDVDAAEIDETRRPDEAPDAYAGRVAGEKATVVSRRHPNRIVLAADTIVVVDATVLGKPRDDADARRMLELLSGRSHDVLTAVAILDSGQMQTALERTTVWFQPLTADDINWYITSGEPVGKAGAYAIQGLAARFVPRIEGSYSNVVGLPVEAVSRLLKAIRPRSAVC